MNKNAHMVGGLASGITVTALLVPNIQSIDTTALFQVGVGTVLSSKIISKISGSKHISIISSCIGFFLTLFLLKLITPNIIIPNNIVLLFSIILGCTLGGLTPDIDHQGSYIGKRFSILSSLFSKFGHRGLTHTPLLYILGFFFFSNLTSKLLLAGNFQTMRVILLVAFYQFMLSVCIGALSHIFLDMLTKAGVPLLFPFSNKKFRLCKLTTGKDDWVGIVLSILLIVFMIT